uniref:Uncharacterized protein n=1 Tax=Arundo donax TaxID=35708 RepID=A0A0A9ACC5_ARUDO
MPAIWFCYCLDMRSSGHVFQAAR